MNLQQPQLNKATDPRLRIERWQQRIEQALEELLPPESDAMSGLHLAMRYAALGGGKERVAVQDITEALENVERIVASNQVAHLLISLLSAQDAVPASLNGTPVRRRG